jgi:uncharacterized protein (TIGR00369 family)
MNSLVDAMPFARQLGVDVTVAAADAVEGTLPWSEERCTTGGVLHGGALMAFADTLGAICAFLNLPAGASTTTIESKTNFMRGVTTGAVRGRCTPLHVGRKFIVVQTDVFDATSGKRVVQTTQTQAVLA